MRTTRFWNDVDDDDDDDGGALTYALLDGTYCQQSDPFLFAFAICARLDYANTRERKRERSRALNERETAQSQRKIRKEGERGAQTESPETKVRARNMNVHIIL